MPFFVCLPPPPLARCLFARFQSPTLSSTAPSVVNPDFPSFAASSARGIARNAIGYNGFVPAAALLHCASTFFRFPCRPSPPSLSVFPLIIISHNPYFAKRVGELEEILETSFFFLRQRTKECQRATRWCTAARLLTQNLVLRWRRVRNFSFVEI